MRAVYEHGFRRPGPVVRGTFVGALLAMSGCFGGSDTPELIDAHGTVTLDGQPLGGATVTFTPQVTGNEAARPASGATDDRGEFTLQYSTNETGARPGKYKVSISTYRPNGEDKEGNELPGASETLPAVYNSQTTLSAEITPDGTPLEFPLKSDAGPVVQPLPGDVEVPSARDGDSC
jgi:hypothetical protein